MVCGMGAGGDDRFAAVLLDAASRIFFLNKQAGSFYSFTPAFFSQASF